jgi:3-oxoacyl-[acyl-carrier protein] reductase
LKTKVGVVTGGGTGLGRAIALLFAREGAIVVVNGRREQPLEETVRAITDAGGKALAVRGDVTIAADAQRLMRTTVDAFGRIDVLVNSAGVMVSRTTVEDCSEDDWHRTIEANLTSVFLCCKHALPELIKCRGNVIMLSSVFALMGGPNRAAYVAAKGALVSLARGMAVDYAARGVRVNTISPAYVETDMNRQLLADLDSRGELDAVVRSHPLGFLGRPEDVAYAALYLASDEANWITGVVLPVDGGMSLGSA